jgi:hypothetical protein
MITWPKSSSSMAGRTLEISQICENGSSHSSTKNASKKKTEKKPQNLMRHMKMGCNPTTYGVQQKHL